VSVYLTPEYNVWKQMKARCYNRDHPEFKNYGRRGIKVCRRWLHSFANFSADMGPRPTPYHSIERERNLGDYTPKNCIWATRRAQQRNTRRNRWITYRGRRQLAIDWARELDIAPSTLHYRLEHWPLGAALSGGPV
jgi:hypothetical protein